MSRRAMLIEALGATPKDLNRMVKRVTPEQAQFSPEPSAWSILHIVAHLAYCETHYLARLQRIVAQELPHEQPFPADTGEAWSTGTLMEIAGIFSERRATTIAFLEGLEQRDWARQFTHETLGTMRLRDQVQAMVAHDNEHLAEITTLRSM
jgi:uncharacterized damage-inducible protein DinB